MEGGPGRPPYLNHKQKQKQRQRQRQRTEVKMKAQRSQIEVMALEAATADPVSTTGGTGEALLDLGKDVNLQKYGEEVANKLTKTGFLPRLQLMTGNSKQCKSGKFPVNKFALISGQDHKDIGEPIDILVLVWRPKAIDTQSDEMIVSHDIESAEFRRIQEESEVKDSGCMFGQEFLVYVPSHEQFATFFMGTKTSRREAPNLLALCQKAATLSAQEIKTKKHTWFSPQVVKCSTAFKLPSKADCLEQIAEFNDPKIQEVERVEKDETETVRG